MVNSKIMADRTCTKCLKVFNSPYYLKRHGLLKVPCDSVPPDGGQCHFCFKRFASMNSMYRHVRDTCKLAAVERNKVVALEAQVVKLAEVVEKLSVSLDAMASAPAIGPVTNNTTNNTTANNTTNNTTNNTANNTTNNTMNNTTNNTVNLNFYDAGASFVIPFEMIRDIFAENQMLDTYSRMHYSEQCDHSVAAPYIAKVLSEVIRKVCSDPVHQNVCLNPKRSDQVMVYVPCLGDTVGSDGKWEVRPLTVVIRDMFDRVACQVMEQTRPDIKKLSWAIECTLPVVSTVYKEIPEKVVGAGKPAMEAHFANH